MPHSDPPGKLPCVILAGGRARRMGGGDKGLMMIGDRRMIDHVILRITPQCGRLAINANGDAGRWAGLGLPVLPDGVADFPGPLAGVLAGLDWAAGLGATHIISVPADTPFLPPDLVAGLLRAAGPAGCAVAASQNASAEWQPHPTCGLWPVDARQDLRAALAGGLRRLGEWAAAQQAGTARFASDPFDPFFNVNTPQDVARATALARQ